MTGREIENAVEKMMRENEKEDIKFRWVSLTLNTFRTRQKQCEQNHSLLIFKVVNQLFGCCFLFLLLFFVHNS
jgi:hypothetical protein